MEKDVMRLKHGKSSYYVLVMALMIVVAFATLSQVIAADAEYEFMPEDAVGDFKVSVGPERDMGVFYKGINLVKNLGTRFEVGMVRDGEIEGVRSTEWMLRDQVVKVVREKERVSYQWSYFEPGAGFSQVNRVVATPEKIIADIKIEFVGKTAPKESSLEVAFFPGYQNPHYYDRASERRILGKTCVVKNANGVSKEFVYLDIPLENLNPWREDDQKKIAKIMKDRNTPWLPEDSRELIWKLRTGDIRFSFSSTDASTQFAVYDNYPGRVVEYRNPLVANKISLRPILTGGRYINILHFEIAVGKAVGEAMLPLVPFADSDNLSIDVRSKVLANLFSPSQAIEFDILMNNFLCGKDRTVVLKTEISGYDNVVVDSRDETLSLSAGSELRHPMTIKMLPVGIYSMDVSAVSDGIVIGKKIMRFAVLPEPADIAPGKSFFGTIWGTPEHATLPDANAKWNRTDTSCKLMRRMGIKQVRFNSESHFWSAVEKTPGKYEFNSRVDQFVDIMRNNGLNPWISGSDLETSYPDWAVSSESFQAEGSRRQMIPKDYALYENYAYQLVSHYKGKISCFETDNEPGNTPPDTKVKLLAAVYRGAKKANPDSKILGLSVSGLSGGMPYIEKVFEAAGKRGDRILDVVTAHYYLTEPFGIRPIRPEETQDFTNLVPKLMETAKKYNFQVWNGEENGGDSLNHLFPNRRFSPEEKENVNFSARRYLLIMMMGVKSVTPCWGFINSLGWPTGMQQHRIFSHWAGGRFIGIVDQIRPWGAAAAVMANLLDGFEYQKRLPFPDQQAFGLVFKTRDGRVAAAFWHQREEGTLEVDAPSGKIKFITLLGREKILDGEQLKLRLTEEPFYLIVKDAKDNTVFLNALEKAAFYRDEPVKLNAYPGSDKGKKCVMVCLENTSQNLTVNKLSVNMTSPTAALLGKAENMTLSAGERKTLPFPVGAQSASTVMKVKVEIEIKGKRIEKEFSLNAPSVKEAAAQGLLIALKSNRPLKVDGDLWDWSRGNVSDRYISEPIVLDKESQAMLLRDYNPQAPAEKWTGTDDLSGTAHILWDDENLYFACKVKDNVFRNENSDDKAWNGDSIQMAVDTLNDTPAENRFDTNDYRIDIALTPKGPQLWRANYGNSKTSPTGPVPGAEIAVVKVDGGVVYEMSIPWKELAPFQPFPGAKMRFNFIINDDDGQGRAKWIGVTPGLAEKKETPLYKQMILLE